MNIPNKIYRVILAGVLATSVFSFAVPVSAVAATCANHNDIARQLNSKFKEKRRAFGLIGTGRMMEVFVSQNGSWTMVITTADKVSCVVAAGNSWEQWKVNFGPTT